MEIFELKLKKRILYKKVHLITKEKLEDEFIHVGGKPLNTSYFIAIKDGTFSCPLELLYSRFHSIWKYHVIKVTRGFIASGFILRSVNKLGLNFYVNNNEVVNLDLLLKDYYKDWFIFN